MGQLWNFINRPIVIFLLGMVVSGPLSYGYAQHLAHQQAIDEARSLLRILANGVESRLVPIEQIFPKALDSSRMGARQRERLSSLFTGAAGPVVDGLGKIGVPYLLYRYSEASSDGDAARVAKEYLALMVPLEKEGLIYLTGTFEDVDITVKGRELLRQLNELVKETKRIVSRSTQ